MYIAKGSGHKFSQLRFGHSPPPITYLGNNSLMAAKKNFKLFSS